jgi:hypothetical protein
MKKVILHIGLPKTGSSAIQNFLALNADLLERLGYHYLAPNPCDAFEITSGNAEPLFEIVKAKDNYSIANFISEYIHPDKTSILSTEVISHFTQEDWKWINDAFSNFGVKIEKIILFTRDVLPYLVSAYDQIIKRHGEWSEFHDWVKIAEWQHFSASQNLMAVFNRTLLSAIHYGTHEKAIFNKFIDEIGISMNDLPAGFHFNKTTVNRSLSKRERFFLKKVNKTLGQDYGLKLSNHFISYNPLGKSEKPEIGSATLEIVRTRFQSQVDTLNQLFFPSSPLLSCLGNFNWETAKTGDEPFSADRQTDELFADFVLDSIKVGDKFNEVQIISRVCKRLLRVSCNKGSEVDLPPDFNPLHYLFLNPDILIAGAEPVQHYLEFGKKENRKYQL